MEKAVVIGGLHGASWIHLVQDNLRCQVVRRAAQGIGALGRRDDLAEPKVRDFDVALAVQQDVLWLQSIIG